jgi:hypothetical protein
MLTRRSAGQADGLPKDTNVPRGGTAMMRRGLWVVACLLTGLGSLVVGVPAPQADEQPPSGFVALFNGKDLSGWTVTQGGNPKVWGAENGILFVQKGGGGWLMTEKEFADFELRLEYKMSKHGNSGVALRAPLTGDPAYTGMEIQLIDDENWQGLQPWQHTGAIYGVVPPAKVANRPLGQWNQMRIVARGPHILVEQNGVRLVDANLQDYLAKHAQRHPGLLRKSGHIGLQSYNSRVEFRRLYVKPL